MLEAVMARKKAAGKKPAPVPTSAKSVAFRVSAEYSEWVDELATHNRTTIAGLIDQALARYARETGFKSPPERT